MPAAHAALARYGPPAPGPDDALLRRHAPLLDRCARRLAARTGHAVDPGDLWSAGAMGLLEAARRFDASQDVRFETFAEHRVRGAMLDELRRMDHLPRRLRADADRVQAARARLEQAIGREPDPVEVADAVGLPAEQVGELLLLAAPPAPVEDDLAPAPAPPADEALAAAERRGALARAVAALPERLQVLLALYYDEALTYREIAKVLGVSEPRVCQLHAEAVKKLRTLVSEM
ncbi:sigma-70 family RNA polymerase sigma factor [Anaeromyxobacter sp. PSR-1]|uniref:sigma-70 family RNA polymerase sigma factor n=1 Tax=Anaeromyxobacter sp. PSR-1 TaxID=1300915 RepID=UPI0005DC7DB5|nr:FliA/WhiG family RNA polymerase sigma factor [Anaeromyxobacter sp. PSR-1]GAO05508.1 RNA polymerase sigma factor FliA [Anaeromyxobacter sp. PSR-1]